ncbi:MAG: hypothetical protein JO301_10110 [Chitinophagaceae bacterium]|nr:hypothetical protein [Chitinophagaceae bacterium]
MPKNIVLLGHGAGVKFTIESLLANAELGYAVCAVVTHPFEDHKGDLEMIEKRADIYGEHAYNVFHVEQDYGIPLKEAANVNEPHVVEWIRGFDPAFIISIGCRNIVKKDFLETFKNKVLNIHTTPLPRYRGAANDSWMILNGEWGTTQFGCMHYIDEGIDTGAIVAKSYYSIPDKCYPIHVFKARMNTFKDLLVLGLRNLATPGFAPEIQKTGEATTFPRLYTPKDGKINFKDFSGQETVKFIYAFGYPFSGAFCNLDTRKINVLAADFYTDQQFHSFANGLIFGKNESGQYKVVVNGGYLLIRSIEVDGEPIAQNKVFKLGRYLS